MNFKIQVIDLPELKVILEKWKDFLGRVFIDTDLDSTTSLNKEVMQLNSLNELRTEGALGASFPDTDKNNALFSDIVNYNLVDNLQPDKIKIQYDLGYHVLRQNELRIISKNESTGKYECDFKDSEDSWFVKLQSIRLNELPFESFEYTKQNLLQNINFNAKYIQGDVGYWFPLINYGRTLIDDEFSYDDFRPLIHSAKIYELLSHEIGIPIVFPLLETEHGARHINYLLKEKFDADEATLETMEFEAKLSTKKDFGRAGRHQTETIIFDQEIKDNGNNYDNSTGKFTTPGYYTFYVELDFHYEWDIEWFGAGAFIHYELVIKRKGGAIEVLPNSRHYHSTDDEKKSEKILISDNILVKYGDEVYVRYRRDSDDIESSYILAGARFWNKPISQTFNGGEILDIQKAIQPDLVIDYIKGDMHLFNIKIYFNENLQTLYFLTPYDVVYYGETVPGFYKDSIDVTESIVNYQIRKEEIINVPEQFEKNLLLKFKKSTDPYVLKKEKDAGDKEYNETFCKFIDRGFDKDTEGANDVRANPYFEPTVNDLYVIRYELGETAVNLPFMLDNLENKTSYRIGRRKLYAHGFVEVFEKVKVGNVYLASSVSVPMLGDIYNKIPYAYQLSNGYTSVSGVYPDQTFETPEYKIVYGEYDDDLYELFYKRYLREFENRHITLFKCVIADSFYFDEDFRAKVLARGFSGDVVGRIISIKNFDIEKKSADIEFIPDPQLTDDCVSYATPIKCKNKPILIVEESSGTFTFSMGGTNESNIESITFQYKYESSTGDFITVNPAQLVNPTEVFVVRMIVKYNQGIDLICKDQIRTRTVDPCGNSPMICTSLVENCLTITECGTHKSTISSTIIQFSLNGTTYQTYNGCIDMLDIGATGIIYIRLIVNYVGGCKQITINDTYVVGNKKKEDCPEIDTANAPSVLGVTTQTGFELVRTGSYNCCSGLDLIQYRKKGSNDEWKTWIEGQTALPLNQDYEAKRVIYWCDKNCDPWCTPAPYVQILRGCAGSVNFTDSITLCTHELKWENPDDASDTWKVEINDDVDFFVPELKTYIKRTCGATITNIDEKKIIYDRWNFRTQHQYSWQENYTLEKVEVHCNDAGTVGSTITIPINVKFEPGTDNDVLIEAIKTSIQTYLSINNNAVNGTDYDFDVEISGTGSTRTTKLIWWAKNVVSSKWYGAQAPTDLLYVLNPSLVQSTVSSTKLEVQKVATTLPVSNTKSPCGNYLKVKFSAGVNKFLDDSLSNFDTLTAYSSVAIYETVLTVDNDSCNKHVLTAVFTCAGTASYLWKEGQSTLSTTNTLTVSGVGKTITLYASCGTCTYKKSIVLT